MSKIRAEHEGEITSYDYDTKNGLTRMVLTPKNGFSSVWKTCKGQLFFEDLRRLPRYG